MSFFLTLAPTAGEADDPNAPAGGIALVQSASGTTADGSAGLTVNFGVPVTAGNSVIALISVNNIGEPSGIFSPALVGGGAGVIDLAVSAENGPAVRSWLGFIHNVSGGETGAYFVTEGVRASMQPAEFSGVADAAATDTDTNSGTSTTASVAGLSGDGLGIVIFAVANATNPFTEASLTAGWTSLGVTGGNGVWQMSAYKIDAIGAVSVTLTGSLDWAGAGSVFAAA